jgi:hypothetical protein
MVDAACTQQILVTVIDKLALGGIVGFAGFLANRMLERYKTSQALREEAAKERIKKLAPIWEELSKIRSELTIVFLKAMGPVKSSIDQEEILRPDDLIKKIATAHKNIAFNRFWLGERLWIKHDAYMSNLSTLAHDLKKMISDSQGGEKFDERRFQEMRKRVDDESGSRLDIEEIIKMS